MATENSVTLVFRVPVPRGAVDAVGRFIQEGRFSRETFDGDPATLAKLPNGAVILYGRNVGLEAQQALVAAAKAHGFSVVVHADWPKDSESECKGSILFFDAAEYRTGEVCATCNAIEPLVSLEDALGLAREAIDSKYSLPRDLEAACAGHGG